jgi:hypothetical protein
MAHLIRYGTAREADSIKYSIQFDLYGTHEINIRSAVTRNRKNLALLTDMGNAILERDDYLLESYNRIVRKAMCEESYASYTQELATHPFLNSGKPFEKNKELWEELMATSMHPSRVVAWCLTEDERERIY